MKKHLRKRCPICYKQIPAIKNRLRQHEFALSGLTCGGSRQYVGELFFFGSKMKREGNAFVFRSVKVIPWNDNRSNSYARFQIDDCTYVGRTAKTPEAALKLLEAEVLRILRTLGITAYHVKQRYK